MKQIILTGGPCSGKTEVFNNLKKQFDHDDRICFIDEVATSLFEGGYPAPPNNENDRVEWARSFQKRIFTEQLRLIHEAELAGYSICIQDRGLLDGAAYLKGGEKELEEIVSNDLFYDDAAPGSWCCINDEDLKIFVLASLAEVNPASYEDLKKSNPHRMESYEEAIEKSIALKDTYKSFTHCSSVNDLNKIWSDISDHIKKDIPEYCYIVSSSEGSSGSSEGVHWYTDKIFKTLSQAETYVLSLGDTGYEIQKHRIT